MKLRARVKPKEGDFGKILRTFFADAERLQEEGTTFSVKEGVVRFNVVFDEDLPLDIIEVISECGLDSVESLQFSRGSKATKVENRIQYGAEERLLEAEPHEDVTRGEAEYADEHLHQNEDGDADIQENLNQDEAEDADIQENLNQDEAEDADVPETLTQGESGMGAVKTRRGRPKRTTSITSILELDEIRQKTNSFDEFVTEVIKWAGIKKRSEYFRNLLNVCDELVDPTWKSIATTMDAKKISYIKYDETFCRKELTKKLSSCGYDFVALEFVKIVLRYKEAFSHKDEDVHDEPQRDEAVEVQAEADKNQVTAKESPKEVTNVIFTVTEGHEYSQFIPSIPMNTDFEQKLAEMEVEWNPMEKAKYVLELMGINAEPETTKNSILHLIEDAVKESDKYLDRMFSNTSNIYSLYIFPRILLAKFVGSFVKSYSTKEVNAVDFLRDLRKLVLET